MINYRNVPPDIYELVKKSLKKDYILSQYPSFNDSMAESFDLISLDGKISIHYYRDGVLQIEGNDDNRTFIRIVRKVNGLISKKDYI